LWRGDLQVELLDAVDVAGEEDEGVERLFLGARGDLAFEVEVGEVGGDGRGAEGAGVSPEPPEAEPGEPPGPVGVGFLGGDGEAGETDGLARFAEGGGDGVGFPGHGMPVAGVRVGG
jgi:hypothetical protein